MLTSSRDIPHLRAGEWCLPWQKWIFACHVPSPLHHRYLPLWCWQLSLRHRWHLWQWVCCMAQTPTMDMQGSSEPVECSCYVLLAPPEFPTSGRFELSSPQLFCSWCIRTQRHCVDLLLVCKCPCVNGKCCATQSLIARWCWTPWMQLDVYPTNGNVHSANRKGNVFVPRVRSKSEDIWWNVSSNVNIPSGCAKVKCQCQKLFWQAAKLQSSCCSFVTCLCNPMYKYRIGEYQTALLTTAIRSCCSHFVLKVGRCFPSNWHLLKASLQDEKLLSRNKIL